MALQQFAGCVELCDQRGLDLLRKVQAPDGTAEIREQLIGIQGPR